MILLAYSLHESQDDFAPAAVGVFYACLFSSTSPVYADRLEMIDPSTLLTHATNSTEI